MSLKKITALILFFILGIFSLLNVVIQQKVIYPSFIALEKVEAKSNISRVSGTINAELKYLELFCQDWARWDDSYDFLQSPDSGFIYENLMEETFEDNDLFHISYTKMDSSIVFTKTFDVDIEEAVSNEVLNASILELIQQIKDDTAVVEKQGVTGILNSSIAPILLTVQPIMNSDRTKSGNGVLTMAKYLHEERIEDISKRVEVTFSIAMITGKSSESKGDVTIAEMENGSYQVTTAIKTVKENETLSCSTIYPRNITKEGRRSIMTAQVIMLLTMVVLMLVVHRLISVTIINPIRSVAESARKIREEDDYSHTISGAGTNEIGAMIKELNQMVDTIKYQTEELHALARIDGLTGLYNRRTLDELLDMEWNRMRRSQKPLSVLLVDVDNFKKYNDHFGHLKGDDVLKDIAKTLALSIKRSTDNAARYGGEEFCLLLPETDSKGAIVVAKRVCENIRALKVAHIVKEPLPIVTVSVGIAELVPQPDSDIQLKDLLTKADTALYKAKSAGRNGWELSSE